MKEQTQSRIKNGIVEIIAEYKFGNLTAEQAIEAILNIIEK